MGISVIIPAYNAALWLEPTVGHINDAVSTAHIKDVEIIIVNDGSSDNTLQVAQELKSSVKVKVIDQTNQGRFLTRKKGLTEAKYENILFIDSRVFLRHKALAFLSDQLKKWPEKRVWNGHVYVEKHGNIIARFGDALTFIGWRRYFINPRNCSYGLKDFDHYPKGTGCFFAPKEVLKSAIKEFEKQTFDIRNSSDDTHLIRIIARDYRINLSPDFSCIYHARTKLSQFFKHSFFRGRFFVDGFLRPGNRFYVPLLVFLVSCPVALILMVVFPKLISVALIGVVIGWLLELFVALALGVTPKDAFSLFLLSPLFAVAYGAGIWRATIGKMITLFRS